MPKAEEKVEHKKVEAHKLTKEEKEEARKAAAKEKAEKMAEYYE